MIHDPKTHLMLVVWKHLGKEAFICKHWCLDLYESDRALYFLVVRMQARFKFTAFVFKYLGMPELVRMYATIQLCIQVTMQSNQNPVTMVNSVRNLCENPSDL